MLEVWNVTLIRFRMNCLVIAMVHVLAHTQHNHFYDSLDFVRENPGEPVPEGRLHLLLDFLEQNDDNTGRHTNNLDGLPPHPD